MSEGAGKGRGPGERDGLEELGDRLRDLLDGVKSAFQNADAARQQARDSAADGDAGDKKIKVETGWSIKLGGLELNGESFEKFKETAEAMQNAAEERGQPTSRGWQSAHPGARRRRAETPRRTPSKAKPTAAAPQPEPKPAPRAAHVEVFDEADAVIITAELPGARQEDIELKLDDGVLEIKATGTKPFLATAELPDGVDPTATPEMRLANGVLEIRIAKRAT